MSVRVGPYVPNSVSGSAQERTADDVCAICLEPWLSKPAIRMEPCGHVEHVKCLQSMKDQSKCPECRTPITNRAAYENDREAEWAFQKTMFELFSAPKTTLEDIERAVIANANVVTRLGWINNHSTSDTYLTVALKKGSVASVKYLLRAGVTLDEVREPHAYVQDAATTLMLWERRRPNDSTLPIKSKLLAATKNWIKAMDTIVPLNYSFGWYWAPTDTKLFIDIYVKSISDEPIWVVSFGQQEGVSSHRMRLADESRLEDVDPVDMARNAYPGVAEMIAGGDNDAAERLLASLSR